MYELIERFQGSDVFSITLPDEPIKHRDWVRASEVCKVLEFKNSKEAIELHCKDWQYREFKVGKGRPALYVCFSGLMRLCLRSKSPVAIEFQDWLTEELLPKLFASGVVILPNATSDTIQMAIDEWQAQKLEAEKTGYLKAANELYDPTLLTDPEKYVLRRCRLLASAIVYYIQYFTDYRKNTKTIPTFRMLVKSSSERDDDSGVAFGSLSINEFFEIATIFNHAGFLESFTSDSLKIAANISSTEFNQIKNGEHTEKLLAAIRKLGVTSDCRLIANRFRIIPVREK